MAKPVFLHLLFFCITCILCSPLVAQTKLVTEDTFFLAKKKGLLGRLGKSLVSSPEAEPVKIAYPYLKYRGRIIRSIEVFPLGINQKLDDTAAVIKQNLAARIGNKLHSNTRAAVIKKNLFFKEGERFLPLLVSDNERFLRDQVFLRDALIVVLEAPADSVDIVVLSRDVFSIGGSININTTSARAEIREENINGTGNQLSFSGIYDKERKPRTGIGAELLMRNISGTFLNWSTGFKTFDQAFNSGRYEENSYYTLLEKPLLNRYTQWTGSVEISYHKTNNAYSSDSVYKSAVQYEYSNLDFWGGYNIGYRNKKGRDSEKRLRHFIAARTFYTYFDKTPAKFDSSYNSGFANINGLLFSYSLYKQNFYRTNFIYGFGRNEDVPIGLSASLVAGWTNKQNHHRPYYGIEFEGTRFSRKGIFSDYKLRVGGYSTEGKLQDIDLLASVDHFTRLRKLDSKWFNRNFVSLSFTRQLNPLLDDSLYLRSDFGLPYFTNGDIRSDERTTIKLESVFYNLNTILGFRFAPFVFGDISFLKPTSQPVEKTNGYSAIGGGIRTRNESFVFGTIELKAYYFPRIIDGMKNWKVDITTKLRFKFNSTFIKKPDFITAN